MRLFVLGLAGAIALVSGCARGREYELRGQILAIDAVRREITIQHGDIRGFMPAMTMPFKVGDPILLEGRTPGDLVTATLVVRDSEVYLSAVTTTGRAPLAAAPPPRTFDLLEPGSAVPPLAFRDESNQPRDLAGWRGRVVVVTFVYTRCPLPDFCPRMDRGFAEVQQGVLADQALRDRVVLLSMSLDPEFDTPAVLMSHARQAGADPRVWHFGTASADEVERFAARFGVSVFREGSADMLTHNLRTAVIRPDGTLGDLLHGSDWTPASLLERVRRARG